MLRVRLLGDLTIEVDGTVVDPPASKRARALLGWLAVDRRMHGRSSLAAKFWPDVLDESARTSLRSALSALRRALGPASEQYLIATRDEVGLAGDSLVWTDLRAFDELVAEGRLEDALELSRGELLAGLDEDWVYERRDEHRDRVAGILGRLAVDTERGHDLEKAIGYTRRQVALDPLAEEPQRDLMRRLAAAGDRAAAVRAYERLAQRLRDELRIVPSQATRELAEQLRHGGEQAAPGPVVPDGEPAAAIVTLLFTDLVGSTAMLSERGEDEAERLRRVHFGLLRDVAAAHGGQEVKNLGDGLMVAFGSAVNAIGCAIGIQQAVHRHSAREQDDRLTVRVGLNIGEPIRDEGDYFGTPVVVAKRLCDKAEGGQILASELLRALVGGRGSFAFRSCGPMALKGLAEPLPACEILWEPATETRIALPPPFLTDELAPLVGRAEQLERLGSCWREALDGRRQVAMLVGDPGIGKTRLAAEFCRAAHAEEAVVLLGRCYEESLVPYQSFVEALRHYVSECPVDELRLALGPHRVTLARLLPELSEHASAAPASSGESAQHEQFVLFEAVASFLRAIADTHPLVLVLDDLHWADPPTLLLLRHLVRATEDTGLLILGTFRETEVDESHPLAPALAELRRARALQTLSLGGLAEDAVATMISSRSGQAPSAEVARSIVDRTQGNPFFVEEFLRDAAVGEDIREALIRVPDSVKDLLLRRLRRLGEEVKRLLTFAAVSGREFELDLLARVSGAPADEVAEALEEAIGAHILEESSRSIGHYTFAHALIREAIYEGVSLTRRAHLHRQIGEAIESVWSDRIDEHASELANHFSAAGEVAKAYAYHSRAAAIARGVYAVEPALGHYSAAIDAAAKLGLEAERDGAVRRLFLQRGRMRYRTGMIEAGADLELALEAARQSGDRALEMEALNDIGLVRLFESLTTAAATHEAALEIARELGDTAAQTNALDRLAVISSHLLDFDRALELGERALELARQTDDEAVVGRAMDSIKLAVWQLGDLDRLEALTGRLERLWRERDDLWYLQFTLQESAFVPIGRAEWDDAAERLKAAIAINRRASDPVAEVLILDALCWLQRSRGAYQEALKTARRAGTQAEGTGWEAWTAASWGWTLLDLRAAREAAAVLEGGVAAAERFGASNELVRCLGQLAWARSLLGDTDQALTLATRAAELLGQVSGGTFLFGAHAYVATARALLASGSPDRGEELLRPVLEPARKAGWREAAATALLVLGLCVEARGELDQARALLAEAAEISDVHGIPAPGWEAHAALARLDHGDQHGAVAAAIVDRIAAELTDDALRDRLRGELDL
jgi:class 3 adenylate cyclase